MAFVPFWFILITILWTGFFVLEGFDLGVGMLHGVVGRDDAGRRAVINTIGPLWDGNEVWLIVAGASMFAAFPGWYATMFSGLYLALVLLLVALILRGMSFEFRGKSQDKRWRNTWSRLLVAGSLLVPLLTGLALADLLHGLPIAANHEYAGSFWDLLQPYGIMAGVTLVFACALHGATFITIKTTGAIGARAGRLARRVAPVTTLLVLAFISWTHVTAGGGAFLNPVELIAMIAVLAAWALLRSGQHQGWSFAATTLTIGMCIVVIFVDLYPNVMVSSTNPAYSLTVRNSASAPYSLKVMTVVAAVLLPVVLAYQGWTYYVFRRRISDQAFRALPATPRPAVSAAAQAARRAPDSRPAPPGTGRRGHRLLPRPRRRSRGRRE